MRTMAEIDAHLEAFEIEAKKAKRERFRCRLVIFAAIAIGLCYLHLVFLPAVERYHEYMSKESNDSYERLKRRIAREKGEDPPPYQPQAGEKPDVFWPSVGLVVGMTLFYTVVIKCRPSKKSVNRETLHNEFKEIRKELTGPGWQERVRNIYKKEAPKKQYSWLQRVLLRHHGKVIIAGVAVIILILAAFAWLIVDISSLLFDPVLVFIMSLVAASYVMRIVLWLLDAKPKKSEQEAKMDILAWIVSEPRRRAAA